MKRTKNSRQRGSHTHGCGSKKKRRGAGNRGGRGNAGTGKKADQKKPSIWKNKKYFGRHGFKSHKKVVKSITLKTIDSHILSWVEKKLITQEQGMYNLNLQKLGYGKVLSNGKLGVKVKITVEKASPKAVAKVKAAGGDIITPQ